MNVRFTLAAYQRDLYTHLLKIEEITAAIYFEQDAGLAMHGDVKQFAAYIGLTSAADQGISSVSYGGQASQSAHLPTFKAPS